MPETAYDTALPAGGRLDHRYGEHVHLMSDPLGLALAARLSVPEVGTAQAHPLLDLAYHHLLSGAVEQLRRVPTDRPTRMAASEPRARLSGTLIDPDQDVVIVDVARGGMVPAHLLQRLVMTFVKPERVRVDHIYLQRLSDPVTGHVTGIGHSGSKLGGPVEGATVLIPDPMAATGRSVEYVLDVYRSLEGGAPRRLVPMHLMVTPEYLSRIARDADDVSIYALRLDRGMSPEPVLATTPGTHWEQESGLDEHSYIVPGAGGLGELLNNSWV